ncbi:MAG: hypothetical protein ACI3XI_03200 [Eubacteriales bacterium]
MKKIYIKPDIDFVNFKMSTSIAGDCTLDTHTYSSETSCGYPVGDIFGNDSVLFAGPTAGCDTQSNPGGICYHVPYGTQVIFGS